MKFKIVTVTPFVQNCSVIWCDQTNEAAVVDPGGDLFRIEQVLEQEGLQVKKVLLTHAHIDHAGATAELAEKYNCPIEGPHIEDKFWIDSLPQQSQMFGFPAVNTFTPTRWLQQGDKVEVGQQVLEVLHCPGHTPGHVVFYSPLSKLALVGDVLFQGSIGRTDFPKGDHPTLIASIKERLWPLGGDVAFVPGHGPMSTFGEERKHNPFVADHLG
ncbi:MAG: MBL fold metallo-hydrolase [Hahellaceae bacterium]|nr:MBL fold metallo-hydrolase [Hahellaceae bacterium]